MSALLRPQHGVEAVDAGADGRLIDKTGIEQRQVHVHEVAPVVGCERPVEPALCIEDADTKPAARFGRVPRVGILLDEGGNALVIGERRYTFDELREHGAAPSDLKYFDYVALYIAKMAEGMPA